MTAESATLKESSLVNRRIVIGDHSPKRRPRSTQAPGQTARHCDAGLEPGSIPRGTRADGRNTIQMRRNESKAGRNENQTRRNKIKIQRNKIKIECQAFSMA
jgi:hypothetical protein